MSTVSKQVFTAWILFLTAVTAFFFFGGVPYEDYTHGTYCPNPDKTINME